MTIFRSQRPYLMDVQPDLGQQEGEHVNVESLYGAFSDRDGTFQMWCEPQHGLPLNIRSLKNVSWLDLAEETRQEVITV